MISQKDQPCLVEQISMELFSFWEHLKDYTAERCYISCNLICKVMLETQREMNTQKQNFIAGFQVNQGWKEKENMLLEIVFNTGQVPSCSLLPPT